MTLRQAIVGILIFLMFASVPALKAQDGLSGALNVGEQRRISLPDHSPQVAAADFDDDEKPDGAILREAGLLNGERAFRIEIHLTAGANDSITFSSNESGLSISALDVNSDGAPDIVIERSFTHERLQIYLNDGHGAFHKVRVEDYPSSDPESPTWQARLTQPPPVVCLPVSRGDEVGMSEHAAALRRANSDGFKLRCEDLLIQSAARAPTSSRAPPSLFL